MLPEVLLRRGARHEEALTVFFPPEKKKECCTGGPGRSYMEAKNPSDLGVTAEDDRLRKRTRYVF